MKEINKMVATGILRMRFSYSEDNFDFELTDERVKDMVQDTVLSHPEWVWENIDVVDDRGPEDGLAPSTLNQLKEQDPEPRELASLDIGDVFSLSKDGDLYVLTDVELFGKSQDNVWAYASAETGEFEGLLRDGACPDHYAKMVHYYDHPNALGDQ